MIEYYFKYILYFCGCIGILGMCLWIGIGIQRLTIESVIEKTVKKECLK